MKIIILLLLILGLGGLVCANRPLPQEAPKNATVVLLHGLCRTSRSMAKMEATLTAKGYDVINVDYPSRSASIEELEPLIFDALQPQLAEAKTVHVVTHSMGGILLRHHLEQPASKTWSKNLGHVVMLAPPSRGAEIADTLGNIKLYKWLNGPAGNQLGTNGFPLTLKPPTFSLGIIAGDRSINPILSLIIPGPDDGKVSTSRVKPSNYTDALQLHVTHACMMRNKQVIAQTISFLETGAFAHNEPTENSQ